MFSEEALLNYDYLKDKKVMDAYFLKKDVPTIKKNKEPDLLICSAQMVKNYNDAVAMGADLY